MRRVLGQLRQDLAMTMPHGCPDSGHFPVERIRHEPLELGTDISPEVCSMRTITGTRLQDL